MKPSKQFSVLGSQLSEAPVWRRRACRDGRPRPSKPSEARQLPAATATLDSPCGMLARSALSLRRLLLRRRLEDRSRRRHPARHRRIHWPRARAAAANHDQAVLIEINTPGGLVDSTREIIDKIVASPVPVIVYVTPAGSRAGSAGIFILEAADVAAMAPGTNAGAAHPVTLFGKPDETMMKKIENDAAALMRSVDRQAWPQRRTGRERGARVEVLHRTGGTRQKTDRLRSFERARPVSPDERQEFQTFRRHSRDAQPDRPASAQLPDDAEGADPFLHHGSQHHADHSADWRACVCMSNSTTPAQSCPAPLE